MSDVGEAVSVRDLGRVGRRSIVVAVGALIVLMGPIGAEALGASQVSGPTTLMRAQATSLGSPVAARRKPVRAPRAISHTAKKVHKHRSLKQAGRKPAPNVAHLRAPAPTTSTTTVSTTSTSTPTTAAKVRYGGFGAARPRRKAAAPALNLAEKPVAAHHGVSMTAVLVGFLILLPMLIVAVALIASELRRRSRTPRRSAGSWIVQ